MPKDIHLLDRIAIAEPCRMSWRKMRGDSQVRFCTHCEKHVYNLSAMTRDEAKRTIQEHDGELCARLYRRRDASIVHRCRDVSQGTWRRWLSAVAALLTTTVALVTGGCITVGKVCPPPTESEEQHLESNHAAQQSNPASDSSTPGD